MQLPGLPAASASTRRRRSRRRASQTRITCGWPMHIDVAVLGVNGIVRGRCVNHACAYVYACALHVTYHYSVLSTVLFAAFAKCHYEMHRLVLSVLLVIVGYECMYPCVINDVQRFTTCSMWPACAQSTWLPFGSTQHYTKLRSYNIP